jgi:hypothetical protein
MCPGRGVLSRLFAGLQRICVWPVLMHWCCRLIVIQERVNVVQVQHVGRCPEFIPIEATRQYFQQAAAIM